MGLNRWCYRILAHVALMRDEYRRPGSTPAAPTQATSPHSQPAARAAAGPRRRQLVTNMRRPTPRLPCPFRETLREARE
jgi:hypothetical protein